MPLNSILAKAILGSGIPASARFLTSMTSDRKFAGGGGQTAHSGGGAGKLLGKLMVGNLLITGARSHNYMLNLTRSKHVDVYISISILFFAFYSSFAINLSIVSFL